MSPHVNSGNGGGRGEIELTRRRSVSSVRRIYVTISTLHGYIMCVRQYRMHGRVFRCYVYAVDIAVRLLSLIGGGRVGALLMRFGCLMVLPIYRIVDTQSGPRFSPFSSWLILSLPGDSGGQLQPPPSIVPYTLHIQDV